jgi:CheY-like chemotaxis protein
MSDKATVLVVEDNRATREGILSFLRDEGYVAVGAENGQRALELIDKMGPPNLILLDLMMPVMDGWQFLAQHRAAGTVDCPVVLLSGLPYIQDAPGVADFLSKPIRFEKLRACLERYCAPSSASGG